MLRRLKEKFSSASIRTKLVFMLVLCTTVSLGTGVVLLLTNTVNIFKLEAQQSADHLAQILGEFSIAPLSFNDPRGAEEALARLASIQSVEAAGIYDLRGNLFAHYSKPGNLFSLPAVHTNSQSGFREGYLDAVYPISFHGEHFGNVSIRLSTEQVKQKITEFILGIGVIFVAVMMLAFLFALRLERLISQPILDLARTARTVSDEANYSLRVQRKGNDEISDLYTAFNQMLIQTEARHQERNRAEAALRESEKRFRDIVQDQTELLCRYRKDGTLLFVNDAYCKFFGKDVQQLINHSFLSSIPEKELAAVKEHIESLQPNKPVASQERFVARADGQMRWVHWTNRAITNENGEIAEYQAVGRDITELKQAEEEKQHLSQQLEHAHRLETIGTLAGGIAHDFNNILTPLLGCIDMASLEIADNEKATSLLSTARESAERAKELVSQILTFSRAADESQRPVQLEGVLENALKLLRASIPVNIRIEKQIHPQSKFVMADPAKIHQTVMNLCTNAFQAMSPKGGVLSVSLRSVRLDPETSPAGSSLAPGNYQELCVQDSGCGMDQITLKRIYEPFFTTKPVGLGTGLGLSVVHGIVSSLGGHISVESMVGRGSRFTVWLPETSEIERKQVPVENKPSLRSGRIMLVDDEEMICKVTKALLERLGYSVDTFTNAAQALEVFRADPTRYHALITDQTMPLLSGVEFARLIHELRSDLPTILTSGYGPEIPNREELTKYGIVAYLTKPYNMEELRRTVHAVMQRDSLAKIATQNGSGGITP